MEAKPVVKNKFWIVEDAGEKIATVQSTPSGLVLVKNQNRERFSNAKILSSKYNINFVDAPLAKRNKDKLVYEYPCDSTPHNCIYDLKYRLPLYTKTNKSKSYYCAGYYLVELEGVWQVLFCPKRITLLRNQYLGPYKTQESARSSM